MGEGKVINLADRRKKPRAEMKQGPRVFCTTCDSDQFRLYPPNIVHCANCHAHISNIGWIGWTEVK